MRSYRYFRAFLRKPQPRSAGAPAVPAGGFKDLPATTRAGVLWWFSLLAVIHILVEILIFPWRVVMTMRRRAPPSSLTSLVEAPRPYIWLVRQLWLEGRGRPSALSEPGEPPAER